MILQAKNLWKEYGDRRLLTIDHLVIEEGDRIGLIGPNGAGKSTLLGILAGRIPPDAGQVNRLCPIAEIRQTRRGRRGMGRAVRQPAGNWKMGGQKRRRADPGSHRGRIFPACAPSLCGRAHHQPGYGRCEKAGRHACGIPGSGAHGFP